MVHGQRRLHDFQIQNVLPYFDTLVFLNIIRSEKCFRKANGVKGYIFWYY